MTIRPSTAVVRLAGNASICIATNFFRFVFANEVHGQAIDARRLARGDGHVDRGADAGDDHRRQAPPLAGVGKLGQARVRIRRRLDTELHRRQERALGIRSHDVVPAGNVPPLRRDAGRLRESIKDHRFDARMAHSAPGVRRLDEDDDRAWRDGIGFGRVFAGARGPARRLVTCRSRAANGSRRVPPANGRPPRRGRH